MILLPANINRDRKVSGHSWAALVLMLASLLTATWLTPRTRWYDQVGDPSYDAIVPTAFGDWVAVEDRNDRVVSPVETEVLVDIYSQIVSRIYLHRPTGRRVMLSIAYVDVQRGRRQLHRPESCYSSQGYSINQLRGEKLIVGNQSLNVFRMSAAMADRDERATYWIRVGDETVEGPPYRVNLTRMTLALNGIVADGLLFRASEITTHERASDLLQDRFIVDLLDAVTPAQKRALVGQAVTS